MKPSRDEIAAAIRAADIGGPGSTVDHEEAAENVLALLSRAPRRSGPDRHAGRPQGDPMTDIEKLEIQKVAAVIPVSREVLADLAATWQERAVILGAADPNPFPRIRLWRTKETR